MKRTIKAGMTDYSAFVFIPDPASTDGSGKTGLVAADLTVSYARMETDNDATVTDATSSLSDLAALTTAHTDWGLKEISSTLAPGLYRLDIADAVFAAGAWTAIVYVMITSSAAAASPMEFVIGAYDPLDSVVQTGDCFALIGTAGAGLTNINLPNQTMDITGSLSGSVGSVTGAVGSVGAGGITAASFAANAITAAKLDPDVTTELQSGLATQASVDTIDDFLDGEVAAILAAVDTEVAAVKAKTDSLTFTVANVIDANVKRINGTVVNGDGGGTPWGP
jgi:hypothetical protein